MSVKVNAYAKINWFLDIRGVLENGYHEMDMLMQQISLADELSFSPASDITLTVDGVPAADNLVLKAAFALKDYAIANGHTENFGIQMALHKRIPARAGLGGGSADCAQTLNTLNQLWNLNYPQPVILSLAEKLGADVPFCVVGGLARVSGFGEKVAPIASARRYALALVTPGGGLSTPEVFHEWDRMPSSGDSASLDVFAKALTNGDLSSAQAYAFNALQAPAIRLMPEIGLWMERFRDAGAQFIAMSGSGSTVFGVFDSLVSAQSVSEQFSDVFVAETLI